MAGEHAMFEGTAPQKLRRLNYVQKKQTLVKQTFVAMFIRNGECGEDAKNSHTFSREKSRNTVRS